MLIGARMISEVELMLEDLYMFHFDEAVPFICCGTEFKLTAQEMLRNTSA